MSDDILDDGAVKHQADYSIHHGSSFTGSMQWTAIGLTVFGLIFLSSGSPVGMLLGPFALTAGLFMLTSAHGVDISSTTDHVREYNQRFFVFKTGKWIPLKAYTDLCILKIGKSKTVGDITGTQTTSLDQSKNEVFLMTHDHRKRFLLKPCNSLKEAQAFADKMSKELDKPITKFNPKISEQTKARLRSRR